MISCKELTDFTIEYMEGQLPADVRFRFESHIALCADCKHFFEGYQLAIRLGRDCVKGGGTQQRSAPEALVQAILQARASMRKPSH